MNRRFFLGAAAASPALLVAGKGPQLLREAAGPSICHTVRPSDMPVGGVTSNVAHLDGGSRYFRVVVECSGSSTATMRVEPQGILLKEA